MEKNRGQRSQRCSAYDELADTFALETPYTATVRLTANPGYTFTGVADNAFIHTGASSVIYAADSNQVTVNFAELPYVVESFGSADNAPNSARNLMTLRKNDAAITAANPLLIHLLSGIETIPHAPLRRVTAPKR